ncbi:MAG: RNA methyltransferase [Actinomycetota bacterium]|nr:RNA methyltransferase [Actinomycetota bacterium]
MITSTSNPRVKELQRLRKRRERDATGTFLVEGARELERAVAAGVEVVQVVRCGDGAVPGGVPVLDVAENVWRALALREDTERVLGVARAFPTGLDRLDLPADPLVLVAAGIEKPGNLGAMLRTAAAAGVAAVIVADPVVDLFNPNVVRASVGALFATPVAAAPAGEVVAFLRERGVRVFATTPEGAAVAHFEAPLAAGAAVVVGPEDTGLPPAWLDAADERIVVPMPGGAGVDSLNAASTAAVVLFEAVRQRSGPK